MNTVSVGSHTSKPARILECVCAHKFQDERYGSGQRVHNPCKTNESGKTGYRCTVCSRTTAK